MSVINRTKLNAVLQMSLQHQAQLVQMVQTMLDTVADNIELMRNYARQQQRLELQQTLHKIRGGYATLGAEQLAQVCRSLEHLLESHAAFDELSLKDVIDMYQQTAAELQTELAVYQQKDDSAEQPLKLRQLYTLLIQQDMQACQLTHSGQKTLAKVLSPATAARFSQHVAALEFATAAQILLPHLDTDDNTDD